MVDKNALDKFVESAIDNNKKPMLVFGANWCGDCRILFGTFELPTFKKMLDEKATWNSFSGSLKKTEKDLSSIPSIRGKRYFGPSQMSFFNLLKHSLSIISVFRKTVLIRSALFIIFYILLIKSYAPVITSIPLIVLLIMILITLLLFK